MPLVIDDLRESTEFLNLLLENMNSAVLVADENQQIHQFNRVFVNLFDNALETQTTPSFGSAAGCVNAVRENKSCGETSQCHYCVLRKSFIEALADESPVERRRLERTFYIDGRPTRKFLEFSARPIRYQGRKMVLMIIYDITEIEKQKQALEEKQSQIEADLKAAAEIQKSLLPKQAPRIAGVQTAWRFQPSRHIGGDIFRIEAHDAEQVIAYMLDACGHGVSAALVAVTVSQFLNHLHHQARLDGTPIHPQAVLAQLDREFPLDRFDCYFTIAYAVLNIRTGHLVYANAGHEPPLILRADGRLEVLAEHGTVIGTGLESGYRRYANRLDRGDTLVLYTDGLIENYGPDKNREGKDLFYESLRTGGNCPPGRLVDRIMQHAAEGRGGEPPEDDMSLLAYQYTGRPAEDPSAWI